MKDRDHPIRQLLDWLAAGGELTDDDLAELPLRAAVDRVDVEHKIRTAANELALMRRSGRGRSHVQALARDLAQDVIEVAGSPARRDPHADVTSPADLAALVQRR